LETEAFRIGKSALARDHHDNAGDFALFDILFENLANLYETLGRQPTSSGLAGYSDCANATVVANSAIAAHIIEAMARFMMARTQWLNIIVTVFT
jgi:hypothetical protein